MCYRLSSPARLGCLFETSFDSKDSIRAIFEA
jgi:hypothetical protein